MKHGKEMRQNATTTSTRCPEILFFSSPCLIRDPAVADLCSVNGYRFFALIAMSLIRLILLSVRHFWKMNVAVACGVAVGTAVLTGALLVGDSMQGSLRDLVLAGLGRIDEVLVADHFFREELAGDKSSGNPAAPVDSLFRQRGNG